MVVHIWSEANQRLQIVLRYQCYVRLLVVTLTMWIQSVWMPIQLSFPTLKISAPWNRSKVAIRMVFTKPMVTHTAGQNDMTEIQQAAGRTLNIVVTHLLSFRVVHSFAYKINKTVFDAKSNSLRLPCIFVLPVPLLGGDVLLSYRYPIAMTKYMLLNWNHRKKKVDHTNEKPFGRRMQNRRLNHVYR